MSIPRSDEIAIGRDLFNGLVDELTDALGWLLVIREEHPEVLRKACGRFDADQRLAQMSAILSGRTLDKRYPIDESKLRIPDAESDSTLVESGSSDKACSTHLDGGTRDLEAWRRSVEEKKDEDSHNTKA